MRYVRQTPDCTGNDEQNAEEELHRGVIKETHKPSGIKAR